MYQRLNVQYIEESVNHQNTLSYRKTNCSLRRLLWTVLYTVSLFCRHKASIFYQKSLIFAL